MSHDKPTPMRVPNDSPHEGSHGARRDARADLGTPLGVQTPKCNGADEEGILNTTLGVSEAQPSASSGLRTRFESHGLLSPRESLHLKLNILQGAELKKSSYAVSTRNILVGNADQQAEQSLAAVDGHDEQLRSFAANSASGSFSANRDVYRRDPRPLQGAPSIAVSDSKIPASASSVKADMTHSTLMPHPSLKPFPSQATPPRFPEDQSRVHSSAPTAGASKRQQSHSEDYDNAIVKAGKRSEEHTRASSAFGTSSKPESNDAGIQATQGPIQDPELESLVLSKEIVTGVLAILSGECIEEGFSSKEVTDYVSSVSPSDKKVILDLYKGIKTTLDKKIASRKEASTLEEAKGLSEVFMNKHVDSEEVEDHESYINFVNDVANIVLEGRKQGVNPFPNTEVYGQEMIISWLQSQVNELQSKDRSSESTILWLKKIIHESGDTHLIGTMESVLNYTPKKIERIENEAQYKHRLRKHRRDLVVKSKGCAKDAKYWNAFFRFEWKMGRVFEFELSIWKQLLLPVQHCLFCLRHWVVDGESLSPFEGNGEELSKLVNEMNLLCKSRVIPASDKQKLLDSLDKHEGKFKTYSTRSDMCIEKPYYPYYKGMLEADAELWIESLILDEMEDGGDSIESPHEVAELVFAVSNTAIQIYCAGITRTREYVWEENP